MPGEDVDYVTRPWWAEGARIRVGDGRKPHAYQDALVAQVTTALTAEHIVKLHNQYLETRLVHGNEEICSKETSA